MNTRYKMRYKSEHYDRIELAVPRGMKQIITDLARDRHMSVNAYIQDLVKKDQDGMFDTMQIAEKNREKISGIRGNMHDGYDVVFRDGHQCHCKTKREVRAAIIQYLTEDPKSLP